MGTVDGTESTAVATRYWHELPDGRVQCDVCPRACKLRPGQRGVCFVRGRPERAEGGDEPGVVLLTYGRSSGFCVDPIEKKPLNHFLPGTSVLSFGTAGCNLACRFCQNWDISKSKETDTLADAATPEAIAAAARRAGCRSVAFTYNDPTIFFEYAQDVDAAGLTLKDVNAVAVTAGYMCPEPRREFYGHLDALNVDLKGFTDDFYRHVCGGRLEPVLETLEYLRHETDLWFEITTLLIPGRNDGDAELDELTGWIAEHLGPDVPLHFPAFHPDFKMTDVPRTPPETLARARARGLRNGLRHVYTGNVHDREGSSTWCPGCGALLIERDWYELGRWHLTDEGRCATCGYRFPGRFDGPPGTWGRRRVPVRIAVAPA